MQVCGCMHACLRTCSVCMCVDTKAWETAFPKSRDPNSRKSCFPFPGAVRPHSRGINTPTVGMTFPIPFECENYWWGIVMPISGKWAIRNLEVSHSSGLGKPMVRNRLPHALDIGKLRCIEQAHAVRDNNVSESRQKVRANPKKKYETNNAPLTLSHQ